MTLKPFTSTTASLRSFIIRYRLLPVQAGIWLAFALIPVWYRFPTPFYSSHYTTRFLIFNVLLWTVFWWLITGLPGLTSLWRDQIRSLWALLLLLLALLAFASNMWAFQRVDHPDVAATAALQFGIVALFAVIVACNSPPSRYLILALMTGLIWNSILTLLQVAKQGSLGLSGIGEFTFQAAVRGSGVVQAGDVRWIRPYGLLPHPNMLAGFLTIALLATVPWILSQRVLKWWIGTSIFLLGLFALLLTFSRAAWGGLVIGLIVMGVLLWRSRIRIMWLESFLSVIMALIVGLIFFLLFQPFLLARAGVNTESIEQRSIADRAVFTEFARRAISEFPILGVGVGNFPWRSSYYLMFIDFDLRGNNVHNVYLSAWAELGTVGFVLMLSALAAGALAAVKHSGKVQGKAYLTPTLRTEHIARTALFAAFVAVSAIGMLDHYPWSLIGFQTAWWGLLAAAGKPINDQQNKQGCASAVASPSGTSVADSPITGSELQLPAASTMSERTHIP